MTQLIILRQASSLTHIGKKVQRPKPIIVTTSHTHSLSKPIPFMDSGHADAKRAYGHHALRRVFLK